MKGILIIVLLAAGIILLVYTGKSGGGKSADETTYAQKLGHAIEKVDASDLEVRISNVTACLNAYYAQNNEYPENLDQLFPDFAPTQDSLNDAWGTRFKIETDEEKNLNLISAGKDRVFGTSDDIKRRI